MAELDPTAFDWSLKTRYSPEEVHNAIFDDMPLLARMTKKTNFTGKNDTYGVKYGGMGASSRFAYAQAWRKPGKGKNFVLTRAKDYSVATIDNETLMASEGDEAALMEALEDTMDDTLQALRRSMGWKLFGDGTGSLATVSSISTLTITLTRVDDIAKFEDGQLVVFAADTASALRSSTPVEVTTIDRDAGTFVISSDPGVVAADLIFPVGDYIAADDENNMMGLAGWLPQTAPTGSDSFFSCNRSVDTQRLAGVRINANLLPLGEALTRGQVRISKWGGKIDWCVVSPNNLEKVINQLGTKAIEDDFKVGDIGFEGIRVRGPKGVFRVYSEMHCPDNKCYMLDMSTWQLKSLGPAPMIIKYFGQQYFHEATSDGVQIRVGMYGNSKCMAPGNNGVLYNFG